MGKSPVTTKNPFKTMFKGVNTLKKDGMHRPEGAGNFDNMDDDVLSDMAVDPRIDHTSILNIGTNAHTALDTHLALTNEHIDWVSGGGATDNFATIGSVSADGGLNSAGALTLSTDGQINIDERNSTGGTSAGFGRIWVKDDIPNILKFTDDDGADFSFATVGGAFHDGFSDSVANEHIDWTNTSENFDTSGTVDAGNTILTGTLPLRLIRAGDEQELLRLTTDRSWVLKTSGSGSAANLTFQSEFNKLLDITNASDVSCFKFSTRGTAADSIATFAGDLTIGEITEMQGDTFWTGDGSGIPYGSMYNDNTSTTVTIDNIGTFVRIPSGFTLGQENLATFGNGREITVTKAGRYKIDWNISFALTSGNNQECEGAIGIGGTKNAQGTAHRKIGSSNDIGTFSGTAILDLAASAVVSLMMANNTSTGNLVVTHASLSLIMVGGT